MRFADPFHLSPNVSPEEKLEKERLMFLELTQGLSASYLSHIRASDVGAVCLWGNSTDLSLLINMTEEQIKALQSTGGDHLAATEKNILGNHLPQLWETVRDLHGKTGGVRVAHIFADSQSESVLSASTSSLTMPALSCTATASMVSTHVHTSRCH